MSEKQPTKDEKLDQILSTLNELSSLNALVGIVPDIQQLVKERQEQEVYNRHIAKLARRIILIAAAIGTFIGTTWAVIKFIFVLGNNQ